MAATPAACMAATPAATVTCTVQQQRRYPQQQQQQRGPRQQQSNPWASWESPPVQQQHRSGVPHQRRQQHQGRRQPRWTRTTCQRCGEDEHFPAECRAAPRAPAPQHRQYTVPSYSRAHAAQYGPPTTAWTAHDSDGHFSTASSYGPPPSQASYGPPPSQASYEPAPPMP